MNTKKMREIIREANLTPPRANVDMVKFYKETFNQPKIKTEDKPDKKVLSIVPADNEYTYIGSGSEPPHMINFMGMQKFFRGDLTIVSHPDVLAKIKNHPCFVKGAYDKQNLFDNDEKAKKKADDQWFKDAQIQKETDRKMRVG